MNADLMLFSAAYVYVLLTVVLFGWLRKDVMNKLYTFIKARNGAKLFTLYRKDGTREEFAACAKTGGMMKHDGDDYQISRSSVVVDRNKNCPCVTLVEGEVKALNPYSKVAPRVDTKALRALFFMEREKAAQDVQPDWSSLKKLMLLTIVCCVIAALLAWFTYQNTEALTHTAPAVAKAASGVL